MKGGLRSLVLLAAAFAVGVLWRQLAAQSTSVALAIADPIGALWVNGIRMTVVPLVVALVLVSILQSRDTSSVGRLGGRAMGTFLVLLTVVSAITALIAPAVFRWIPNDPAATEQLRASAQKAADVATVPGFSAWLVALVPTNPIKAAVDGAMLPLLVFTAFFGVACRALQPQQRALMLDFFRAISDAMLVIVRWVLAVSPIGIAALALSLGIRLGAGAASTVTFYLVAHSALIVLAIGVMYVGVVAGARMSLRAFAAAAAPAQVVAMSTRSSIAALPAMLEGAKKLGVSGEVSGFMVPFAVSVFRMNQAVSWVVGGLFVAALYGLPFGAGAVAQFAVLCVVMSFSVPGIPSGSLFMIAPFFPLVGLPVEGVGILIALDAVPDIFKTTLNVTGHLAATAIVSHHSKPE